MLWCGRLTQPADPSAKFDAYAREYQNLHGQSVAVSGEESSYFFEYKRRCLERLVGARAGEPILDYGCGIGLLLRELRTRFPLVDGYDPSGESRAAARLRAPGSTLFDTPEEIPEGRYDLALLSTVLHHVPVAERPEVVRRVVSKLRPGGRLVIFEHNPLNPLTRRAVALCPFDDDAILLWPRESRRLMKEAGLAGVRTDYIVFLPRALAKLRWIEPYLRAVPLGAQVMVVGTRPGPSAAS